MSGIVTADIADILLAVRRQLIEVGVFIPECIALSQRMRPPMAIPGGFYGRINLTHQHRAMGFAEGAGRQAEVWRASFNVYVRGRDQSDRVYEDTKRLTDEAAGLLRMATAVLNALDGWFPSDSSGNQLTLEPIFAELDGEPGSERYAEPDRTAIMVECSVLYAPPINQTYFPEQLIE